ncbi:MAG: tRNA glutamyl-Q(34) synthetase GluQRS [Actinomycetota bacterium]
MTVGRFAPSPTGPLHLGNLRTAALAWAAARSEDGSFLIRLEDQTSGAAADHCVEQLADLAAIGLDWDEPVTRQSARSALHRAALEDLVARGLTYECTCTRREVREAASAPHGEPTEGTYPGTCLRLPAAERRRREREGRRPALRLRAEGVRLQVTDLLLGEFETTVDDLVLARADGVVAYHLAVVVDDADTGVTQVVRGDDLWTSTPRQVLLQRLLALPTPSYLHVPLVVGSDGARLAKRHGAVTLRDRLAVGETAEEVLGWCAASLGWAEPGTSMRAEEFLARFDVLGLPLTPTRWPR